MTRPAVFEWQGRQCALDLDTKTMNCPRCGLRIFLNHTVSQDTSGALNVSPSIVCPPAHGGCSWHVTISNGRAA